MTHDQPDPAPHPYVPRHLRPDDAPAQRKSFPFLKQRRRDGKRYPSHPDDTGDTGDIME
ncbi:hypothetical protein GCM10010435_23170 [Winogradskya consettensis]|uniref:Uncharacterized protein n=1 Tax=Winogradskya consettensis TaxID=113560 RepID=A0A919SND0_9ACTN|nr:hypothetical protein [Actinoplanes consettensis]GIM75346.1 hypothetical protein Aco04nite_44880 [Actinoplanes consettensis]